MRLRPLFALLLGAAACEPIAEPFDAAYTVVPVFHAPPKASDQQPPIAAPKRLKVMAYNVKFGGARIDFWFDYFGDRVQMTEGEVRGNLANLAALVNAYDPDVFMTEDLDVNSRRSAYTDMLAYFLAHTKLAHTAYFSTWSSRYIPSEGLGRMEMGNAIFSKYPIVKADMFKLSERADLSAAEAKFYLKRQLGHADIDVGGAQPIAFYVVHTEAYDRDGTKQKQLAEIRDVLARETKPFVVGGDFNELPPGATKLVHFDDEAAASLGTEFEQPPYTPEKMQPFFDTLRPAIPLASYGTTEQTRRRFYSHTVRGPLHKGADGLPGYWNRTLDYLFAAPSLTWDPAASDVLQGPGRQGLPANVDPLFLSDHAPVVGTVVLP